MSPLRGIALGALLGSLLAPVGFAQTAPVEDAREALDSVAASLIERPDQVEALDEATVLRLLERVGTLLEAGSEVELRAELLYRRAMLRLEPLPTHDVRAAKQDLEELLRIPSEWVPRARYALAWMEEVGGRPELALDAYRRLEIDDPASDAAAWARVGRARLQLRAGHFGTAAAQLQRAIDTAFDAPSVRRLRELAVRGLMRGVGAGDPSTPHAFESGMRAPLAMLATPSGGVVLATRRPSLVARFSVDGARTDEWSVAGLQGVTISPAGRLLAAGKETIFRLESGGRAVPIADLGAFRSVASIAAAADGSVWLLERRGRRIGRLLPGAARPEVVHEDDRLRLSTLVADGRRLLVVDDRSRSLLAIEADGAQRVLFDGTGRRLEWLAVDRAGRIALLDGRNAQLIFIAPSGRLESVEAPGRYLEDSRAVALGPQGELMLHDGKSRWVAVR